MFQPQVIHAHSLHGCAIFFAPAFVVQNRFQGIGKGCGSVGPCYGENRYDKNGFILIELFENPSTAGCGDIIEMGRYINMIIMTMDGQDVL